MRRPAIHVLMIGMFATSPALAQQGQGDRHALNQEFGREQGWGIYRNDQYGRCVGFTSRDRDGIRVWFANPTDTDGGFFTVADRRWSALNTARRYRVEFRFDETSIWGGELVPSVLGNQVVFVLENPPENFMRDFADRNRLRIVVNQGRFETEVPLRGTRSATLIAADCDNNIVDDNLVLEDRFPFNYMYSPYSHIDDSFEPSVMFISDEVFAKFGPWTINKNYLTARCVAVQEIDAESFAAVHIASQKYRLHNDMINWVVTIGGRQGDWPNISFDPRRAEYEIDSDLDVVFSSSIEEIVIEANTVSKNFSAFTASSQLFTFFSVDIKTPLLKVFDSSNYVDFSISRTYSWDEEPDAIFEADVQGIDMSEILRVMSKVTDCMETFDERLYADRQNYASGDYFDEAVNTSRAIGTRNSLWLMQARNLLSALNADDSAGKLALYEKIIQETDRLRRTQTSSIGTDVVDTFTIGLHDQIFQLLASAGDWQSVFDITNFRIKGLYENSNPIILNNLGFNEILRLLLLDAQAQVKLGSYDGAYDRLRTSFSLFDYGYYDGKYLGIFDQQDRSQDPGDNYGAFYFSQDEYNNNLARLFSGELYAEIFTIAAESIAIKDMLEDDKSYIESEYFKTVVNHFLDQATKEAVNPRYSDMKSINVCRPELFTRYCWAHFDSQGNLLEEIAWENKLYKIEAALVYAHLGEFERAAAIMLENPQALRESRTIGLALLDALPPGLIDEDERVALSLEIGQRLIESDASRALRERARIDALGDASVRALAEDLRLLRTQLKTAQLDIGRLVSGDFTEETGRIWESLRNERDRLSREVAALEQRLGSEIPRDVAGADYASVDDVVRALEADQAYAMFAFGPKSYAWVFTPEGGTWLELDIDAPTLEGLVRQVRGSLTFDVDQDFDFEAAHEIYRRVFAPLEPHIGDARHLYVTSSGALTSIPLTVLLRDEHGSGALDTAPWFVDRYAVTILPSATSLSDAGRSGPRAQPARSVLAFGDPVFASDAPPRGEQPTSMIGMLDVRALAELLPPLPGTRAEVDEIARLLAAADEDVLLGADASETALKSRDLSQYGILYFATHALVSSQLADHSVVRAEPAVVLSLPDRPTELDDGLLEASEIAQLNLNADWVVLSACNTAAGSEVGAEALSGLASAFLSAGARSLLVSHWEIADEPTARLMTSVFAAKAQDPTLSNAEALRAAILDYRRAAQTPLEQHPRYWAPFIIVGEPR